MSPSLLASAVTMEGLDRLMSAVERVIESGRLEGLGEFEYLVDERTLRVWWVGEVPDALRGLEPEPGYALEIRPAPRSRAELDAVRQQVHRMHDQGELPGLVSIGLDVPGGTVVVGVDVERTGGRLPEIPAAVPVRVEPREPITPGWPGTAPSLTPRRP